MTVAAAPEQARRRLGPAAIAAGTVALLAALLVGVLATRQQSSDVVTDSPLLGKPAPEIAATTLDGDRVRLSTMRGRYVVVNFFATWCVPCQREHPELVSFHQRHAAVGDAMVLMVVFDDEADRVRSFFAEKGGMHWPAVDDKRGRVALDYGVFGPPESFVVDPDGVVVSKLSGEVTAGGLDRLLASAEEARS